jgi:cytochrome c oxidase assembly protein Cox11
MLSSNYTETYDKNEEGKAEYYDKKQNTTTIVTLIIMMMMMLNVLYAIAP